MEFRYNRFLKQETFILDPGELRASDQEDLVLSTLLGSCVAVCLFDPKAGVIGMNHFLLANHHPEQVVPPEQQGRYGAVAMEMLIQEMQLLGAEKNNMQAKAFGGADVMPSKEERIIHVAKDNIEFTQQYLKAEGIPLVSSDLGGTSGRVVHFFRSDYSVYVRKLQKGQTNELALRDVSLVKPQNQ